MPKGKGYSDPTMKMAHGTAIKGDMPMPVSSMSMNMTGMSEAMKMGSGRNKMATKSMMQENKGMKMAASQGKMKGGKHKVNMSGMIG